MADDLIAQLVALLVDRDDGAALLPVRGGDLLHGVHEVGVKGLAQRLDLLHMEGAQRLGGFVQRHGHALLVILVGGGGVGRHLQRIQNGDDLVHGKGHAVVELLVSLTGGALAVVLILGGHPQQLILGLIGILLSRVQLCLLTLSSRKRSRLFINR